MAGLKGLHGPLKAGLHAILLAGTAASSPPAPTASITSTVPSTGTVGVAIPGLAYTSANVSTLYLAVLQGGVQISRTALSGTSGQLPSYTPSSAGNDQFALYGAASGGTALYTSPVIAVAAAPVEALVLAPVSGSVTSGSTFTVSGTLSNVSAQPALSVSVDGGALIAMTAASPYLLAFTPSTGAPTGFTFTGQALSTGSHTVQVKDTTHGLSSNVLTVTAAAAQQGGGSGSTPGTGSVAGGYYFGPVGAKTATISGLPTTAVAGTPLSPAGSYTISGTAGFGTAGYVGVWNVARQTYEMVNLYYGTELASLAAASGPLTVFGGNPVGAGWTGSTWAVSPLTISPYNGGGAYTIRICSDPFGRFVLAESPTIQVSVPAIGPTTSIYPNTVNGAGGMGSVFTVGPGQHFATISNAMEAINADLAANPASRTYWDAVLLVWPSSNDAYYLDDCGTGACPNATPFTGNSALAFKGYMPNVPLTIRGNLTVNGNRPHFTFDGNGEYFGKGYWLRSSFPLTLENLYTSGNGGPTTENDGGGNRPFLSQGDCHGGDLNVNNCLMEYWPSAILGANQGFGVYCRNTEFRHLSNSGQSGNTHSIYISGPADELVFQDSICHSLGYNAVGHLLKSRCQRTHLIRARLLDGSGNGSSYVLDVPEAGELIVEDSVLQHGPGAINAPVIRHGEEGAANYGTYYDGIYMRKSSVTTTNLVMVNQLPPSETFGAFKGLLISDYVDSFMPHAVMTGTRVFGLDLTSSYFENEGTALVPPDPNLVLLGSVPTIDLSSPPATGSYDPTTGVPASGTALTTGATGGSVAPLSGAAGGQFSTASATLSGGNIGWIGLTGPNGPELPRYPVQGGSARVLPLSTGSYTAGLYGAATGGSAVATSGTFTVALPTTTGLAAPGGLTVVGTFSEGFVVRSGVVSGQGNVTYALGYRVGSGTWATVQGQVNSGGTAVTYCAAGLTPGTSYQLAVQAVDATGPGATASLTHSTAGAGSNVANAGPYTFSSFNWDNGSPQGKAGSNSSYGGADLGKVDGTVSNGGAAPDAIFFQWSLSNVDPSVNPYPNFQTLSYYSSIGYYNNDLAAGPTGGQTCYPWIITSDGYCHTDGSSYTFA